MKNTMQAAVLARRIACWYVGAALLIAQVIYTPLWAQSEAKGEYQVYVLRHKSAGDVEKTLSEMLVGFGSSTHLVADSRTNQLLLRGPAAAQEMARQLVDSIDKPLVVEPSATPPAKAVLRSYTPPAGRQAETVKQLRSEFAENAGVRIALDTQSGQLFVFAPPEVHPLIEDRLATLSSAAPTTSAPSAARLPVEGPAVPPGAGSTERREQFVRLLYSTPDSIEKTLRDLFGSRLEPLAGRRTGRSDYLLRDTMGRQTTIGVDRSRNGVIVVGREPISAQLVRLVGALDTPLDSAESAVRILPVRRANPTKVRQAVEAYRTGYREGLRSREPAPTINNQGLLTPPARLPDVNSRSLGSMGFDNAGRRHHPVHGGMEFVTYLFQDSVEGGTSGAQPIPATDASEEETTSERLQELGVDVEVEALPDLDVIILRGRDRDVDEVSRIIEELERLSAETEPVIDIYQLRHVDGNALLATIARIAEDLIGGRQGRVNVTPLIKPNALLLVGWGDAVEALKELIAKLDQPVPPETQLHVFRLRHAPVATAMTTVQSFFSGREGLGPRAIVTADVRTNSLIVQAAPRDLEELKLLIDGLDRGDSESVNRARIFTLKNSLAVDLGGILQAAIMAARGGGTGQRSAELELLTVDPEGQRLLKSGLLDNVQITPNSRTNTLVVSGPSESMELIEALIKELDAPAQTAQIKVFRIVNSDANSLVQMLRSLLPSVAGTSAGAQLAAAEGETSLVPVRFSTDERTNTIIATGSEGDLKIIEALLLRLDGDEGLQRQHCVYRLKNSPAVEVATAVAEWLQSERLVQQAAPGTVSPFQQIEKAAVVVPERLSNSLIISAAPRYFDEIMDLVRELDAEPPQVMIQVLIAEVALNNVDEFGMELGLQDSILFDRSLISDLVKTTTSTQESIPGGGVITTTTDNILAATLDPGFAFNNLPLGNSGGDRALQYGSNVGAQGLSNFAVGRLNSDLAYGGLVLSASSESVSILLRALQETRRIEVLSRPQVMTMDNVPAYLQVGKQVPRITNTTLNEVGQLNTITMEDVGLILGVTPRISPDGMVVMEVDATKSELSFEDAIPISISDGQPVFSPSVSVTTAQTTIAAADGETIVLGGLITKGQTTIKRRIPYISEIPILGHFFRYDSETEKRTELLIIMTPNIVRTPEEAAMIKEAEAARMHWCLADMNELQGMTGLCDCGECDICNRHTQIIYPDKNPRGVPAEAFDESADPETFPLELMPPNETPPSPGSFPPPNPAPGSSAPGNLVPDDTTLYQPTPAPTREMSTDRMTPHRPMGAPPAYPPRHPGNIIPTSHAQPAVGSPQENPRRVMTAHYQPPKNYPTRPLHAAQPGTAQPAFYQYPQTSSPRASR